MQKSVGVRRCRLVPVLRAETNTLKIVEMCVGRLVPILTYNVNYNRSGCRLSPYLRGETKTQESVEIRVCVCVCGSLVGGTPRQPKSSNFHTRGLSTICHFLAPPQL